MPGDQAATLRDGPPLPRRRHDRHRLAVPARHRPGPRPHRLRDVPGQPERGDAQPRSRSPTTRRRSTSLLLTHAHLDHCGLIPHLVNEGYRGRIIATKGTCELAELVLLDSGQAPGGVREARGALGEAPPRPRRRGRREGAGRLPGGARPRRRARSRRRRSTSASTTRRPRRRRRRGRAAPRQASEARRRSRPTPRPSRRPPSPRRCPRRSRTTDAGRRPDRRPRGRPPGPAADVDDRPRRSRSTRPRDAERAVHAVRRDRLRRGARGRAGRPRDVPRRRPHPRARRSSASGSRPATGDKGGPGARDDDRLLRRPRPAGHADHPRPDGPDRPPTTSSSSRRTAAASTSPRTRRSGSSPRRSGWSSDAGGVLLVPSFAIGRTQEIVYALDRLLEAGQDPGAAALPRLADGLEGVRHLPPPRRVLRRGDAARCSSAATRRSTTRTRP